MLRSGNDAAHALAEQAGGSLEGFVDLMNEKAMIHGLNYTVFHESIRPARWKHLSRHMKQHVMLWHAMENEKFRKIATAKNHRYKGKNKRIAGVINIDYSI